jgi:polar amino acid transport system substrate-binding protein
MQELRSVLDRWGLLTLGLAVLVAVLGAPPGAVSAGVDAPPKGKSPTLDRVREQKALRAGIGIALPWLGQNPKTGQYFGPAVEIGERVAKVLGVELKVLPSTWDVIIAGLQADKYDILLAPLFATEKRRQVVDFVNWTEAGTCYAVLKDNNKVNTLEDLDQPTVTTGVWKGTGTEHAFVAKYKKAKLDSIVMAVTGANRLEDVLARRIDAATLDSPRAHLVVHQYPQMKIVPGGPDNCIKNPDIPIPIGMAFSYGDAELKKFLEAVVADMKEDIKASLHKHSQLEFMLQPK